jgi:hypothetical protein
MLDERRRLPSCWAVRRLPGRRRVAVVATLVLAVVLGAHAHADAAENLRLAPGLSFTDDSSARFPIEGDALGDATVGAGRATIAFFGAAHCWNTNREAERVVALYAKLRERARFVVVDVEHPSEAQRALLTRYYQGAIPTVVVFAPDGTVLYARAGETARTRGDSARLEQLVEDAIAR